MENTQGPQTPDLQRLARFMDGFLSYEIFKDIPYPENIALEYEDMNLAQKKEFFEFAFHELFRMAADESICVLKRNPTIPELGLIKRRIVNYLKSLGMEFDGN
jgi:hypothetical protein